MLSTSGGVDNKVSQLRATQLEPLDYNDWSISKTFMKAYEKNLDITVTKAIVVI